MPPESPTWLDYFSGGVPTSEYFRMTLEDLAMIVDESSKRPSRVNEVCYIGLIAYFEAFCKDHFASVLNIEPALLDALRQKGQDIYINPTHLLELQEEWRYRLGFLVAEKFDFGTPQKINALYGALLKISPFSKDEARFYEKMLSDRNLLVHHGGTHTFTYLSHATLETNSAGHRPYFSSLAVTAEYFEKRRAFIEGIAKKILKSTHEALKHYSTELGTEYAPERQKAMNAFLWWGEEDI